MEAVNKSLTGETGTRFCADIELGVIGVGVEAGTLAADDFTQQ